jgi:multidrug efflux pump subunit AcrB
LTEQIRAKLDKTNIIFPGGEIFIGTEQIIIEPSGDFESVDDLRNLIISDAQAKEIVYLGDVADVYRGYVDPRGSIVRINGVPGISLGINVKAGGNVVELGKEVDKVINRYREIYPIGVEFIRTASQDQFVDKSVKDFQNNLVQSVVIVLIVMLLFLGLRTGIVVAALVPSVMVITLMIMSFMGVGLNQISLAALIMALGMLVDNAIVMVESTLVKMEGGKTSLQSVIESANELRIPLLISTLTTSAAFVAFYLAETLMGDIVGPLFVVISIALLTSWVLALTFIPIIATILLKVKKKDSGKAQKPSLFDRLAEYYKPFLLFSLKHRWLFLVFILLLFFVSTRALNLIPKIFMPDADRALVTVNFELPAGTRIDETEKVVVQVEEYLRKHFLLSSDASEEEGVKDFTSFIGEGAPKYDLGYTPPEKTTYTAHMLINTTSDPYNSVIIDSLNAFCFREFPDLIPSVKRLGSAGGNLTPIEVRISGRNPDLLLSYAKRVEEELRRIPGTLSVRNDWGPKTKKVIVDIDQERAQLAGITNQDVAISLETFLTGRITGVYREDDKTIPITMINETEGDDLISRLKTVNIFSQQTGQSVPLSQVANIDFEWQFTKISRRDLFKTVTVISEFQPGYTAAGITDQLQPFLNAMEKEFGFGYYIEWGGDLESQEENMGAVFDYLPLAFGIIILLLIGQFNSIKKPAIILLTIPLGLIGVVVGLLIGNSYFGFFAFLGLISLAGIVINNAIVLIDRIDIELTENKRDSTDAIVAAARERFRPILLTTATTVVGLIPLWLGGGIMFEPLALAILFGLMFATVLTLVFVPILYSFFYKVSYKGYELPDDL